MEYAGAAIRLAQLAVLFYSCALIFDHQITDNSNAAMTLLFGGIGIYTPTIASMIVAPRGAADSAPLECTIAITASLAYGLAVVGAMASIDTT